MSYWSKLSMKDRADVMKLFLNKGISDLDTIRREYNTFAEGGDTNPGMTGMMKSKLATAAHFGNPTARRMTNYDARSYTWPGEYEYDNGIGELKRGNVFVGSYDNLVTPQIQDTGNGLTFVDDVWSPENDQRSYMQSLKFSNEKDARYFGNHYKEIAPMMNLYSNGGKIHIRPSHRGRLTELKKRTGKSEAELYKTGGPAVRKMITFARNARKWKHGLGGNLFDGTTENSQQMVKPNIFQRPDGSYFYSANDIEIDVTPMNTLGDNPAQWTYTDSSGKIYRPTQSLSPNYTLTESENTNPLVSAANNYFRELDWRAKNDPSSIALQGKYTMPLILSPVLSKGAAVALANPYVDAALTSGFGAHGLQKLANGEADWTTALEIAPLGRLAKPLYKEATTAIENYRYPLGRLTVPENYTNITPKIRTRVGDVEIDNPLLAYRQGDASMGADFLDTGIVSMKNGSYDNPMFAQGKLFYGSPSENLSLLDPSINSTSKTRSGRVFLLRKPKDQTAKSDLLVSDIDMAHANKDSHIISPYTKILDEEGNAIGTKVNEDIRRVPFAESPATSENTTLYRWKPNYGYKKVDSPESTYVMGKELVDDSGNLNVSVDDLLEQIKAEYPYTLNPEDLVNKGLDGTTDLSEHIQAVVESAQEYPLPKGISRKEFVTAALYHDLGKMFGSFGHGTNSTAVVSELNLPITKNIIEAVSHHMNPQEYFETASQLEKALHAADVGRGMKYKTLIEKYPYLKYNDIP